MATESRVGGLLDGKSGVTVFHVGDDKKALQSVCDLLGSYDIPINKLLPAHVNYNVPLLEQVLGFAHKGDTIDITSSVDEPVAPAEGIARTVQAGIPPTRVTLSSDGNGSQPFFDNGGNLTHISTAGFEALLEAAQVLVKDYGFSISDALRPLTSNVAGFPNLTGKGGILPGNDADLLIVTPELCIEQVYACGKLMVKDDKACAEGTLETT